MTISSVFTDLSEYSRYHSDLSVIRSTIIVTSPVPSDVISAALCRSDGGGNIVVKNLTLTTETRYNVAFDLNRDAMDELGIYRAKQGDYTIVVTDSQNNVVESKMFAISIVPVKELKEEWTKGVTFYDYEILEPRIQPQKITGVIVTEVSENHYKGPFTLTYTETTKELSWKAGTGVPVVGDVPYSLLLLDGDNEDYIMVTVSPNLLPSVDKSEMLYIDNGRLKDSAFIRQIRAATNWVEERIVTKLEPTIVDTDGFKNGLFFDEVAIPETYYKPRNFNKWLSFKIPYPNILDLELTGYFNTSKSVQVPRTWLVWNERSGICELVPTTSAQVMWNFYGGIFVMAYLYNYASIPSFWHYRATVGLRDLKADRSIVREAIAKKASYELLNSAGSAYRAGYASQSTSRDGVSQSEGYTASATYGTYGGHFTSYKEWLAKEVPKMRIRFCGIQYTTI